MSLLTSFYTRRHGVQESVSGDDPKRASPQLVLLGETLQAAGYRTAAFSENPYVSPLFGLDQGFEELAYAMIAAARYDRDLQVPVGKALAWIDEQGDAPFFAYRHVMTCTARTWPTSATARAFARSPLCRSSSGRGCGRTS